MLRSVKAILTSEGAQRKGYPKLANKIVTAIIDDSRDDKVAEEVRYQGKTLFGWASYGESESDTIRLL